MGTPPFDPAVANRWFAIELNNQAWEFIEKTERTPAETADMLAAALASRWHWFQVGTLLNKLRAESLVATAYLAADWPELSLVHAQACHELSLQAGDEQTPFDRACVHGSLACALARLDRWEEARTCYADALAAVQTFTDPEERPVFERFYPQV